MRFNEPQRDADVGLHERRRHAQLVATVGPADRHARARRVVVHHPDAIKDLRAEQLRQLIPGERPMSAQGDQHGDVRRADAGANTRLCSVAASRAEAGRQPFLVHLGGMGATASGSTQNRTCAGCGASAR